MNPIESAIAMVSPRWALQRAQARRVLRSYQGAEANRLTDHKKPKNRAADQELLGPYGADALRAWARALVRDNAYAWNVVDTIVSNVIGAGITAQSTLETKEGEDVETVNDFRDKVFSEWCEVCDINGQLTFSEIQILCMREIVEAGEVFIRLIHTSEKEFNGIYRPVPLALELIEADRIATERDTYKVREKQNGNRVIRGIELDDTGKPVAYWIYPEHPQSPYAVRNQEPQRIAANDVIHLFRKDRVGQSRGVTWFAPSMSWMRDLGVYVDNEIQASAVASCFGVAIKTETPIPGLSAPEDEDVVDDNGNALQYLEPALVTHLRPGESIETINPGRPNSASEPWINLMLRGICAGTGTNYEAIAKDFSKTSYSSSRSSKLEDKPRYKRYQQYIVVHLCQPIWDEFCNSAAREEYLKEMFADSTALLDDRRGVTPVEWQLPAQPWVDPASEQNASRDSIKEYMSTYQDELGQGGRSWRSVFYQAAKEQKLRMSLGLMTTEERTAQMMAKQTESQTGIPSPVDETESAGTGEWMGLSRLQWNRNRKALMDVLNGLSDGSMSPALATAQLSMIGMSQKNIEAIIADVSDGTVDNPIPEEVTNA